jgi:TonB family protein
MIDRGRWRASVVACVVAGLCVASLCLGSEGEPVRYDPQTMNEPKKIHHVTPTYPEEAKEEGVQGVVVLDTVIGEDGSVRETRVLKGEDARLVGAAQDAVGQWRYEPVRDAEGRPIRVLFTVTVRFMLAD